MGRWGCGAVPNAGRGSMLANIVTRIDLTTGESAGCGRSISMIASFAAARSEGINMLDARDEKTHRISALVRTLAAIVAGALSLFATHPSRAAEPVPAKIAVFDFELDDRSAGGGIIAQDAVDTENLKLSSEAARRMLAESGRYSIVDTGGAAADVTSAEGIQHCNGCEGPLARKLGADQSMVGVFTRVNRTEYTLQILVRDTQTGAVMSNHFTGLRMGANYAWPRGVKWLMNNKILVQRAE